MRRGTRTIATAALLLMVSCSSGGGEGDDRGAESTASISPTTTDEPTDTTLPAAPSTTEQTVEAKVSIGQSWTRGQPLPATPYLDAFEQRMVSFGDVGWFLAGGDSGTIHRLTDNGSTWTSTAVDPPGGPSLDLVDITQSADGRLAVLGGRGNALVVLLSDDDGATWREVAPPSMVSPGGATITPVGIVATAAGFVAAGSIGGPDWHARLWNSPDGENWVVAREVRGTSPHASAEQLLYDGNTLVLIISDHPCAEPRIYSGTWSLGVDWIDWPRVFSGTSPADLTLLTPADHPLVSDLDVSNCAVTGSLAGISEAERTHPILSGAVIDGTITLLQAARPTEADIAADEADDDEALMTSGMRRLSQLVDGEWTLVEVDGVVSATRSTLATFELVAPLVEVNGRPAIIDVIGAGTARTTPVIITPDDTGEWQQTLPDHPLLGRNIVDATVVGDALVAITLSLPDPWTNSVVADELVPIDVWISSGNNAPSVCDLAPSAKCVFTDLTQHPDYPDFAGVDLSGADLAFATLGAADFTGANFSGARLWGATTEEGFTATGANFTGAQLQEASLSETRSATFEFANLYFARLSDATDATFGGAILEVATITLPPESFANLLGVSLNRTTVIVTTTEGAANELSLAGFDLTGAGIGPYVGPLLKIVSLDGAILTDAQLRRVDLTAINPAAVDLSMLDVSDELSLCPDGRAPDDLPFGTCVRVV